MEPISLKNGQPYKHCQKKSGTKLDETSKKLPFTNFGRWWMKT